MMLTEKAHPRWCGENLDAASIPIATWGSSPLVRGKPEKGLAETRKSRLIPAGAGKTSKNILIRPTDRAHPRWCGENSAASRAESIACGSSPLVRGKPTRGSRAVALIGLIPAGAGKTFLD